MLNVGTHRDAIPHLFMMLFESRTRADQIRSQHSGYGLHAWHRPESTDCINRTKEHTEESMTTRGEARLSALAPRYALQLEAHRAEFEREG